jgi:hypothetical protein
MWSNSEIKDFQAGAREATLKRTKVTKDLDLRNALEEQKLRNSGSVAVANVGKDTKAMELEAEKDVNAAKAKYYGSEGDKNATATSGMQLDNSAKSQLMPDVVATGKASLQAERSASSFDNSTTLGKAMALRYDVNQMDGTVGLSGKMKDDYYSRMGAGPSPVLATPSNSPAAPVDPFAVTKGSTPLSKNPDRRAVIGRVKEQLRKPQWLTKVS